MGLFDPEWVKSPTLKEIAGLINGNQKNRLEKLRKQRKLAHEPFAKLIMESPGAYKIGLERHLKGLRMNYPPMTPKQEFSLLYYREKRMKTPEGNAETMEMLALAMKSPTLQMAVGEELTRRERVVIQNPDQFEVLKNVNDLDDLVWCLVKELNLEVYDGFGIVREVNSILGLRDKGI